MRPHPRKSLCQHMVTDSAIVWSSSDDSIATVDQTGRVAPKETGEVTITAKVAATSKDEGLVVTSYVTAPILAIDDGSQVSIATPQDSYPRESCAGVCCLLHQGACAGSTV